MDDSTNLEKKINLNIRNFIFSDLSRIMEIERASFAKGAFSEFIFMNFYHSRSCLFIVARSFGVTSGYMITCYSNKKGNIASIAVDPSSRKKGIGKALVKYTISKLKGYGVKVLELEVRTTNTVGINFWKSMGFLSKEVIPNYYGNGINALKMIKLLP